MTSDIESNDLLNAEQLTTTASEREDDSITTNNSSSNDEEQAILASEQVAKEEEHEQQQQQQQNSDSDSENDLCCIDYSAPNEEKESSTEAILVQQVVVVPIEQEAEGLVTVPTEDTADETSIGCCRSTSSCSSVKETKKNKKRKKKRKKKSRSVSRSREGFSESGTDRESTSSKKKEQKKKTKKKNKNKKNKKIQNEPERGNSTLHTVGCKSKGKQKQKQKRVTQIDMSGGVSEISFDHVTGTATKKTKKKSKRDDSSKTMDSRLTLDSSTTSDIEPESTTTTENERNQQEPKTEGAYTHLLSSKPADSLHEIQEIELRPQKRRKPRSPRYNSSSSNSRTIEYGGVYGYNRDNDWEGKKNKRRGRKRNSERTATTLDFDEEDQYLRLSSSTMDSFRGFDGKVRKSTTIAATTNTSTKRDKPSKKKSQRRYDGQITDYDSDNDSLDIYVDDSEYTDDEDDIYMREMGYNEPSNGSLYDSYYEEVQNGLHDDRFSFRRTTFDLADTGIRDTKCCLIFAGLFFVCSTIGVSILIGKLTGQEW